MRKIQTNIILCRMGLILLTLFASYSIINFFVKNNFISLNESDNIVLKRDNNYSPGFISTETSQNIKGWVALLDRIAPFPYYGPTQTDQQSITCCDYTDRYFSYQFENKNCVPEKSQYYEITCPNIDGVIYQKREVWYCESTRHRKASTTIGNTVQYSDWKKGSCTNKWPTWVYGMTEKESLKAIDEYTAEITTRTIEADLVNHEYIVKDEVCTYTRRGICSSTPPPEPPPYVPLQYCYSADEPLQSYYREYHDNPTAANWKKFIGSGAGEHNCCSSLIKYPKLRGLYFDSGGNNIYSTYCAKPNIPEKACFVGSNSYQQDYEKSEKTETDIATYKNACCAAPGAEDNMGSFYNLYCLTPPAPENCAPNANPITCTQEPDLGYIYEAGEKGITQNNIACLLGSTSANLYSFIQPGFANNKYCQVSCKEDVDLYFPGFGFNSNSTNGFLIKAGQYFTFKPYIDDKVKNEYLPTVNQARSCVVRAYPKTLAQDLIGTNDLNGKITSTGYYSITENALKAYYDLTKLMNNASGHMKEEYLNQRAIAADVYRINSAKIVISVDKYNQCAAWNHAYQEEDYPLIDDFWYKEMDTENLEVAEILKKIKVEIQNQSASTIPSEYCDENLNSCKDTPYDVSVPTFKQITLPDNVSGTQQSFIDSFKSTPINVFAYFIKKSAAKVDINYTLGTELYALKPNGLAVDSDNPVFKSMDGKYTFNRIGFGLPVNFDTFGGKRYNYQFVVKNLGKKDGNLMKLYKEVQQDQTAGNESVYICHYEVSNEIICPPSYCPTICADPLNCSGDGTKINNPVLQAMFRSINNEDINPNDRVLGTNWSDEKGQAAKTKIEEDGEEIYAKTPQYSFKLNTNRILEIKKYNDEKTYASFEMICNQESEKCRSEFVSKFASVISDTWIEYDETTKQFANEK